MRKNSLSPRQVLMSASLSILTILMICVIFALHIPKLQPTLQTHTDHIVLDHPMVRVYAFATAQGQITASSNLLLEEPDVLPTYAEFNQFMQHQTQLAQAAAQHQLHAHTDAGVVIMSTQPRHLAQLPWMFWFQLFVGAAGALTGAAIYAFSQKNAATRYYALTGLGYLMFAPSAAIYSTRESWLDGQIFQTLSAINHFGALFFTASLVALLWHYPTRLRAWPIAPMAYALALVFWLLDQAQWLPNPSWVPMSVLLLFSAGIVIAIIQGIRAKKNPIDRASFRWFMLSIFLGTGLFAGGVLIPNALNYPLAASQGLMFGAFLLMYWGLALGLLRYRLFELESWWFSIWSWFLSGLSIVMVDVLLVSALAISSQTALILSVALIGWLYFPIRQWMLGRLQRDAHSNIHQWLPQILPMLLDVRLGSDQERQIRQRWPAMLQTIFTPLQLESLDAAATLAIEQSGQVLIVPDLRNDQGSRLQLHHAARGQRLFIPSDLQTVTILKQLTELAIAVARARDTGARLERERIARDIHDDLGARLLSLLQQSPPEQQLLVRDTLDDLRHLLNSLDGEDVLLEDAIANWRVECYQRISEHTMLEWQAQVAGELILSAFEYHHLTRMVREALTNAMKHSRPSVIRVSIYQIEHTWLAIDIHNDINPASSAISSGRGLENMQRRAQSLNGHITWQQDHEYHILIRVRLSDSAAQQLTLSPTCEATHE